MAKQLSGGVKALILLIHQDKVLKLGYNSPLTFASGKFGENCEPFLLEIAEKSDIHIKITSSIDFCYVGEGISYKHCELIVYSPEIDKHIANVKEFIDEEFMDIVNNSEHIFIMITRLDLQKMGYNDVTFSTLKMSILT